LAKKSLPKSLAKEIEKKKPFKKKWLANCFGIYKQAFYKRLKIYEAKENQEQILKELVASLRKNNSNYGRIKLHHLLKQEMVITTWHW